MNKTNNKDTLPTWNEIPTVKPCYSIVITIIFSMLYIDMGQLHSMIQQFCPLVGPTFLFLMFVILYVCMTNPKYCYVGVKGKNRAGQKSSPYSFGP